MKSWKVVVRGREGAVTFNFKDTTDLTTELLKLELLDQIIKNVQNCENYFISTAIEQVLSPEGEDMTDRQVYVLFARSKEFGVSVGYLLGELNLEEGNALMVLGLWPEEFADMVRKDKESYLRTLASIVLEPEAWEAVDLTMPT